jgi:hypothetical protein
MIFSDMTHYLNATSFENITFSPEFQYTRKFRFHEDETHNYINGPDSQTQQAVLINNIN